MKPTLILCLGNELLADDAVGPELAIRLRRIPEICEHADVVFEARAGFALLDQLADRRRALIVDSICSGEPPGTVHEFPMPVYAPGRHLTGSHQVSLPVALALGQRMGFALPDSIDVIAVEAADVVTIGGAMSPEVLAAIPRVVEKARRWVRQASAPPGSPASEAASAGHVPA